jgi:hypothetical protein
MVRMVYATQKADIPWEDQLRQDGIVVVPAPLSYAQFKEVMEKNKDAQWNIFLYVLNPMGERLPEQVLVITRAPAVVKPGRMDVWWKATVPFLTTRLLLAVGSCYSRDIFADENWGIGAVTYFGQLSRGYMSIKNFLLDVAPDRNTLQINVFSSEGWHTYTGDATVRAKLVELGIVASSAPSRRTGLEEGKQTIRRLAEKWGLADLPEVRVAAISPQVMEDYPGFKALMGGSVGIGDAKVVFVPERVEPMNDLIFSLVKGAGWIKPVTIQGYGRAGLEEDPILDTFESLAGFAGASIQERVPPRSAVFHEILRQIVAHLSGLEEGAIEEGDLVALEQVLLVQM